MSLSPFNLIYGGFDLTYFNEINKIIEIYNMYSKITKTNGKNIIIPSYVTDIDDDNFGLKDAFGNNIDSITGYFINDQLIENNITFPAKKTDYWELYNQTIPLVRLDSELKWLKLFKNDYTYNKLFNMRFIERYEYFLNVVLKAKIVDYNGTVKSIEANDAITSKVTIDDENNNSHEYICNNYFISVSVNDNVTPGDIIEKKVIVRFSEGKITILKQHDVDNKLIELSAPIDAQCVIIE